VTLLNEEWDLENLYSWNNVSCRGLAIQLLLVWPLIAQQIIHRATKHCVSTYFPYSGQNIQRHTLRIYVEICLIIVKVRVLTSLSYPELTVVKDNSNWNGDRLLYARGHLVLFNGILKGHEDSEAQNWYLSNTVTPLPRRDCPTRSWLQATEYN